jgi:Ca2+-binding RTX toxin-like protein
MNTPALNRLTDGLQALSNGFAAFSRIANTSNVQNLEDQLLILSPLLLQLPTWQALQGVIGNIAGGAQQPIAATEFQGQIQQIQTEFQGTLAALSGLPFVNVGTIQAIGELYASVFSFYGALLEPGITTRTTAPAGFDPYAGPLDPLLVVFTPGSDLVPIGYNDFQVVFGRTGDDTLYPFDHTLNTASPVKARFHIDALFGDTESATEPVFQDIVSLLLGLPFQPGLSPRGKDRFVLGDFKSSFFGKTGATDFGFIFDFDRAQDSIQLQGSAANYIPVEIPLLGTALFERKGISLDLVSVVFANYDLNLNASYIKYSGSAPAPVVDAKVKQVGTAGLEIPSGITTDAAGNVYTFGVTNSRTEGLTSGASQGSYDFVLTKYNSQGVQQWSKQFGSSRFDSPSFGLKTDKTGQNVFVIGSFVQQGVVWKFDTNSGNEVWSKQFSVRPTDKVTWLTDVTVDDLGNSYISGLSLKEDTSPNASFPFEDDSFVTKFSPTGDQLWLREFASGPNGSFPPFDEAYGISLYKDPVTNKTSVYTTGWTFGDFSGQVRSNKYDTFIAKYDDQGNIQDFSPPAGGQLINQFGTAEIEFAWDVANDSAGNVYTFGRTTGNLGGAGSAKGKEDVFLARTSPNGVQDWVIQFGTAEVDSVYFGGMEIDAQNNIFITGFTSGNLGGTNAGSFDAWVARYSYTGTLNARPQLVWIKQLGTAQLDYSTDITVDNLGNVYVTGFTEGSFGAANKGATDAWVAKLDANSGNVLNFNGGTTPPPPPNTFDGQGGKKSFTVIKGNTVTLNNFGGFGNGAAPTTAAAAELDTIVFSGDGLTARNLLISQSGSDLILTFEGSANTQVVLRNFQNLENGRSATNLLGNLRFHDQSTVLDDYDVASATATPTDIPRINMTHFFNNLNNEVQGRDLSDDVMNGQGGNDILSGLGGSDVLRGGDGDDTLNGGSGNDALWGGSGADRFVFGENFRPFSTSMGQDTIYDFNGAENDRIVLSKSVFGLSSSSSSFFNGFTNTREFATVSSTTAVNGSAARIVYDSSTGGLYYNQNGILAGLGTGALFATLSNRPTLSATNSFRIVS